MTTGCSLTPLVLLACNVLKELAGFSLYYPLDCLACLDSYTCAGMLVLRVPLQSASFSSWCMPT